MLKYNSKFYIVFLTSILTILSIYNVFLIIVYSVYISIVPLIFQSSMIYFIYKKKKILKTIIKIWSIIFLIGGIAGWVAIFATIGLKLSGAEYNSYELDVYNLLFQSLRIMIPLYFLLFLNESITESTVNKTIENQT